MDISCSFCSLNTVGINRDLHVHVPVEYITCTFYIHVHVYVGERVVRIINRHVYIMNGIVTHEATLYTDCTIFLQGA